MTGKTVMEYTFKKNEQAITLASKWAIKINNELVQDLVKATDFGG